ncbi:MAG: hypothetical protein QM669_04285 [Siphonobacter sp.]
MKGFTLKEILLLSASLGFLIIWVSELIGGRVSWHQSYFWIMFSVFSLLGFQYFKNQRITKEKSTPPVTAKKKK